MRRSQCDSTSCDLTEKEKKASWESKWLKIGINEYQVIFKVTAILLLNLFTETFDPFNLKYKNLPMQKFLQCKKAIIKKSLL